MSLNHRVIAKIMHHASKSRNRAQHIANDFTNASDQSHGRTFNRIVTFHFMNLLMHTNEIPFFFFWRKCNNNYILLNVESTRLYNTSSQSA